MTYKQFLGLQQPPWSYTYNINSLFETKIYAILQPQSSNSKFLQQHAKYKPNQLTTKREYKMEGNNNLKTLLNVLKTRPKGRLFFVLVINCKTKNYKRIKELVCSHKVINELCKCKLYIPLYLFRSQSYEHIRASNNFKVSRLRCSLRTPTTATS